jgi:hypothetical protein
MNCSILALGSVLALAASGTAAWVWLKTLVRPASAFFAAIVYMLLPYHLSIDLYGRAAYAEFWSFVWMPLVYFFLSLSLRGSLKAVIGLAASLACLVLTHLPSFIIFFPVFLAYAILQMRAEFFKQSIFRLVVAIILAFGLSAVYWLPAMATQDWVSMQAMRNGYFYYANNFLFEGPIIGGDDVRQFAKVIEHSTILSLVLASVAWAVVKTNPISRLRIHADFSFVVAGVSMFLMLPFSSIVWRFLPPLQRIQFPWRLNILMVLVAASLVAFALDSISSRIFTLSGRVRNHVAWSFLFLVALLIYVVVELAVLRAGVWRGEAASLVRTLRFASLLTCIGLLYPLMTRPSLISGARGLVLAFWICLVIALADQGYKPILTMRTDFSKQDSLLTYQAAAEHRPRWVPEYRFTMGSLAQWSAETPWIVSPDQYSHGEVLYWRSRLIALRTRTSKPSKFEIKQFYYPGWSARLRSGQEQLLTRPSSEGLIEILVPAGDHRIDVTLDPLQYERTGIIITLSSLFASSLVLLVGFRQTAAKKISSNLSV